jgi:hypothetical protein
MLYDDAHLPIDQSVVHRDVHAASVRVVLDCEVAIGLEQLVLLFPHEIVFATSIGCGHSCVYTDGASAAVVAERIAQHLHDVEHRD